MKKIITAICMFMSVSAWADAPSLVGNWACETSVNQGNIKIQTKNQAVYQPNNQASETIQVNYYDRNALQITSNIRLNYRWEMVGNRQKISNLTINHYDSYNHLTKQSAHFGEIATLKQMLTDQYQANPWQTITFIDDNTHRYTADDGMSGICVRES